jgi:hydrogenase/urease accessory protein HupE
MSSYLAAYLYWLAQPMQRMKKILKLLSVCSLFLLGTTDVAAHDARPVAVTIRETLPGIYQPFLRVPPTVESNNQPVLVWPDACTETRMGGSDQIPAAANMGEGSTRLMQCPQGLAGAHFRLEYPLFNPSLATWYSLVPLSGEPSTTMLAPTEEFWVVPAARTTWDIAGEYLRLGIGHIIGGLDHLLFVFGLLVIAKTARRSLLAVTGFTLSHSITLSLAALGFVNIPIAPVEAVIALSIVFLAHEISQHNKYGLTYRYPLIVAFGFGLLHGLGFASALGEIGLVQNEAVWSLLFFNIGVELGQLSFIAAVVLLVWLLQKLARKLKIPATDVRFQAGRISSESDLLAAYIIGIPSAYWLLERLIP